MDKMIHASEFRLRVLLTNKCNKACNFCLNDFQEKGEDFASMMDVSDCLRAYGQFMKSIGEESIVTFSGGEPGLHPCLNLILARAAYFCDVVKVATNGRALHEAYFEYVDKFHVGVYGKDQRVIEYAKVTDKIAVQTVVTEQMSPAYINDLVKFYRDGGIQIIKLFADFFAKDKAKLFETIVGIKGVCTRFTGKQINRGPACAGCEKDCVTLKALWYFPDGGSSTCPQGERPIYDDLSWDETVEKAYAAHKKEN